MKPILKIPRSLLLRALADLERPHRFAGERLGFFSFKHAMDGTRPLLLCFDYHSIPDGQYVPDSSCGGRIDGDAIRDAMGRALRGQCGQLWVHTHGPCGHPLPSRTDLAEGPNVARSLSNAQPNSLQGWGIISNEGTWGQVRTRQGALHDFDEMFVVGWPLAVPRRPLPSIKVPSGFFRKLFGRRKTVPKNRYDRQSFLGPDAQHIIERAQVGVVGLGGGGSHIVQQLAHIGFKNVVFCDTDRVDYTNLNRLIGATLEDARLRRFKTTVATRLYRGLQPDACLQSDPLGWEAKRSFLRECDVVFGCLDSFVGRRDLEAFCRAHLVPLIDIGMIVERPAAAAPDIYGQAILSMPGEACMQCLQFLTSGTIAKEVQNYNAGSQPQVVWPNGILASTAIGVALGLVTGWSLPSSPVSRLNLRGSRLTMSESNLIGPLKTCRCCHYPLENAGDPVFRKL